MEGLKITQGGGTLVFFVSLVAIVEPREKQREVVGLFVIEAQTHSNYSSEAS